MRTKKAAFLSTMAALSSGAVMVMAGCKRTPVELSSGFTEEQICPPPGEWEEEGQDEGPPQGRFIRGGCLANFPYFYEEQNGNRVSPPSLLPPVVRGHHRKHTDIRVHVEPRANDACIKDHAERPIDTLPLYEVWVDMNNGSKINLCSGARYEPESPKCPDEGEDLKGRAIAVPGYWDRTGNFRAEVEGKRVFTLACSSGVAAKCAHWGYVPWVTYPNGAGTTLANHHKACVRAGRAQYFDKNRSFTCEATPIDVFDKIGIRKANDSLVQSKNYTFEAAWGAEGLVCLSRARYSNCEKDVTNKLLSKRCEHDYGLDDEWPRGALIMNRSADKRVSPSGDCPSSWDRCMAPPTTGCACSPSESP
jgi:hypothetical protein